MKPSDQQKAIGKICGWKFQRGTPPTYGGSNIPTGWINPKNNRLQNDLPKYLSSYDAIIPALHKLDVFGEWGVFVQSITNRNSTSLTSEVFTVFEKTPAELAEAFLKAKGKWVETK